MKPTLGQCDCGVMVDMIPTRADRMLGTGEVYGKCPACGETVHGCRHGGLSADAAVEQRLVDRWNQETE